MDLEELTNFGEILSRIDQRHIYYFAAGAVLGGLTVAALFRRWWWLLVLIFLLPAVLIVLDYLLPVGLSESYRLFFLGMGVLAVLALVYYVA